tara:strand:+ start:1164 stop:1511 length:348 start_codon:yes stop_codon:yes gene_type:complete
MKSYKDFVSESYAAKENLEEAFGLRTLGNLAWKGAKAALGSDRGRRIVGGIGAYKAGEDMMKDDKSDKGKATPYSLATGAAAALMPRKGLYPFAGAAALGLHLNDYIRRQMKRGN